MIFCKLAELELNIEMSISDNFIQIDIISNITIEPYLKLLLQSVFNDSDTKIHYIPYSEYNENEYRNIFLDSDLIVIWLNIEELFPNISNCMDLDLDSELQHKIIDETIGLCGKLNDNIAKTSNAHIHWISFEDYSFQNSVVLGHMYNMLINTINLKLAEMLYLEETFIDLKYLIAEIGIANAYDNKGKYRWNAPYSKALIESVAKEIYKQHLINKGITKKCLVLDCDNVLWGGILSEDRIENIKLGKYGIGKVYQDFQRFVLYLYYHGVILAVCSKNDLEDVLMVFQEHNEMILRPEHIACFQVNWDDKPNNIKKISEKLNISLCSMVFVDDTSIEIKAVKEVFPDVSTILFNRDMKYKLFSCFNLHKSVSIVEVKNRIETYQTDKYRETLKSKYEDYADYIKELKIKMEIREARPIEYSRISELTQRTNKCTNGRRYTVAEIKERVIYDEVKLYSISVSDLFSELGIVGAIEIEGNTLTLFSLSCRALGREIEKKMLDYVSEKYKINSIEYHSTGKNEAMIALFNENFPNATVTI